MNNVINLDTASKIELQAAAYEVIKEIDRLRNNLNIIESRISKKEQEEMNKIPSPELPPHSKNSDNLNH